MLTLDVHLLNRIKQRNAEKAAEAVRESLQGQILKSDEIKAALARFESAYGKENEKKPHTKKWVTLYSVLSDLRSLGIQAHGIKSLDSIIAICKERATEEDQARIALSAKAFELWQSYSHLNSKKMCEKLKDILPRLNEDDIKYDIEALQIEMQKHAQKHAQKQAQKQEQNHAQKQMLIPMQVQKQKQMQKQMQMRMEKKKKMQKKQVQVHHGWDWEGLYKAVYHLWYNDFVEQWTPILEDWEEFLLWQHNKSVSKMISKAYHKDNMVNVDFGQCDFCWRFVPGTEISGHGRFSCNQHKRNIGTEYDKGRELKDFAEKHYNPEVARLVNELERARQLQGQEADEQEVARRQEISNALRHYQEQEDAHKHQERQAQDLELDHWVQKKRSGLPRFPDQDVARLTQDLEVARHENALLRMERDILKKAAAYFAKESL